MAAHVLRLRIALLLGALRGDSAHVSRAVIGLLLLAGATAVACWALLTLGDAPTDVVLAVIVLAGSAVTLGFALAPLIVGATDPLDPRRFTVLGLPSGRLAAVLAVAGFISVPTFALIAVSVATAIVWADHGVTAAAGAVGAILGVATCVLLARVCMALTALFLRERRSRELSGLFALAVLVVVVPVGVFFASLEWGGRVPTQLAEAVGALALTPIGAAWAFPGRVAQGGLEAAAPSLLIALATLLGLGLIWFAAGAPAALEHGTPGVGARARRPRLVRRRPRHPERCGRRAEPRVLAARPSIPRQHHRDPDRRRHHARCRCSSPVSRPRSSRSFRCRSSHSSSAGFRTTTSPTTRPPYGCTSRAASAARRIGSGVSFRCSLIGIPLLAVLIPVSISLHGRWALLPAMVGICASLYLTGLGLSSISSVVAPYAVSRPGESPFQQPQRTGAGGAIAQSLVMLGRHRPERPRAVVGLARARAATSKRRRWRCGAAWRSAWRC